ncbi:hypothetical protein EIP86_003005 [Pleurotus ostreatoroseus]|nr:hypothetical protein EIP86_003005 [Pleurotus ostreatoroseus]
MISSNFAEVIEIASRAGEHDGLVRYLQMAHKHLREPKIDTELAYAYAKTDCLRRGGLLGISNWTRLATTLIYLSENQGAAESARKAGNTEVWKQAQICGLDILVHAEELPAIVQSYERRGHFDEILALLEAGLSLERAHIFKAAERAHLWPELVFLYIKYDGFDNAGLAMSERSADPRQHNQFRDVIVRVENIQMYYKSLTFYLRD